MRFLTQCCLVYSPDNSGKPSPNSVMSQDFAAIVAKLFIFCHHHKHSLTTYRQSQPIRSVPLISNHSPIHLHHQYSGSHTHILLKLVWQSPLSIQNAVKPISIFFSLPVSTMKSIFPLFINHYSS